MTPAPAVVWGGDPAESSQLLTVVAHNCECEFQGDVCVGVCGLHTMLLSQRTVNGLVFMHRQADRLRREEWSR